MRCLEVGFEYQLECSEVGLELSFRFCKCQEVRLGICLFAIARMMTPSIPKPTSGHIRFVRNSHCRCGCGGAQVFECVGGSMPRIERRRLTLDDRDDRRRDRVQRERPEVELEFVNPTSGRPKNIIRPLDAKRKSYRRRCHEEEPNEREPKTTRQNKDVMNEGSWIVSLIVLEVSPGGSLDVPARTPENSPDGPVACWGPKSLNLK